MLAHATQVGRGGSTESFVATLGQHREDAAAVVGALLALDEINPFEAGHLMGHAALRGRDAGRQLGHAHAEVGLLGQEHEDLVVG